MPVPSPQEAAADWARGLQNASDKMARGVQRVTQAPGASAAQATDLWAAKVAASKEKFRRKVGAVSLGDWQNAMVTKGVSRAVEGAQQSQAKFERAIAPVLQVAEQASATAKAMPKGTVEQGIARAAAVIRMFADYGKRGGAG